ncbi:MAG TPA: T9SS type A sorting domain-containing protein [Saprospiraceae bacterium]|nr:T9SS type A sorting domain-containing protein [Saprospiraceae bacterium]
MPSQVEDCYTVKVPVLLGGSPSLQTLCGFLLAGEITGENTSIVGIELNDPSDFQNVSFSGQTFNINNGNDATIYEPGSSAPFLYLLVETSPGETFDVNFTNTLYMPNSCSPPNPICDIENITYDVPNTPLNGVPAGIDCLLENGNLDYDLEMFVDVASATFEPDSGTYTIPVKVRDNNYIPGVSPPSATINYNRLDLRITYSDLYGNMDITDVAGGLGNPDFENGEIVISTSAASSFSIVNGESSVLDIKTTLPLEPTQGGSMAFDIEYFRLEYFSGACCQAPVTDGTFTVNEPLRCQQSGATTISVDTSYLSGDQVHHQVFFRTTDPLGYTPLNRLLIELEISGDASLQLDEAAIHASVDTDFCPSTCNEGGGIPNTSDCLDIYQVNGKWRIAFGFCDTITPIFYNRPIFEIIHSAGCNVDIKVLRAQWDHDNNTADGYCVLDINKTYTSFTTSSFPIKTIWEAECPVENVEVCRTSDPIYSCESSCEVPFYSDTSGVFYYDCLHATTGARLKACKMAEFDRSFVSTADIIVISRHILGVAPFSEAWQYVAADVDGSETITTLDQIAIRKFILSISTEYPGAPFWRFKSCYYDLGTGNPFANIDDTYSNFSFVQAGEEPCFQAIKMGNVTNDSCAESNPHGELVINLVNGTVELNHYNLLFKPQGFTNIAGFQFALRYEHSKLDYASLHAEDLPWVDNDIRYEVPTEPNLLKFVWFDESGGSRTLNSNQEIMRLRFQKLLSLPNYLNGFSLDESELPARAWLADGTPLQIVLQTGGGHAPGSIKPAIPGEGSDWAIEAEPNPFEELLRLRINTTYTGAATLTIYDASGREMHRQDLDEGDNIQQLEIPTANWPAGAYYYRLQAASREWSAKLLKQ